MQSSYEKNLTDVNTRSNLYICISTLIEPASSQEVLTLKALGFFLQVQHWGGGVFSTSSVRLDPDILES